MVEHSWSGNQKNLHHMSCQSRSKVVMLERLVQVLVLSLTQNLFSYCAIQILSPNQTHFLSEAVESLWLSPHHTRARCRGILSRTLPQRSSTTLHANATSKGQGDWAQTASGCTDGAKFLFHASVASSTTRAALVRDDRPIQ